MCEDDVGGGPLRDRNDREDDVKQSVSLDFPMALSLATVLGMVLAIAGRWLFGGELVSIYV